MAKLPPFHLNVRFMFLHEGKGISSLEEEDFVESEHSVPPHTSWADTKGVFGTSTLRSSHTRGLCCLPLN